MTQDEKTAYYTAKMLGPIPPPDYKGNGMGVEGTQWLVRLLLWTIPVGAYKLLDDCAARFHDYGCGIAKTKAEREQRDIDFASGPVSNCRTILEGECNRAWQFFLLEWTLKKIYAAVSIGTDVEWAGK